MAIWTVEIKEIERINESLKGHFPELGKELGYLIKTEDENVALLYSRRSLEVIITDLCECELKKSRGTEPLKGIIDKLNKEEKVPANIVASMHGLNTLSTFGTHPKDFDPEQVKPVLSNLAIILKWYLKYKGIEILSKSSIAEEDVNAGIGTQSPDVTKLEKSVAILPFRNDSKDEENTYFINGLMEEVLNNLQKIKDLRVISRTSVEQYRNQTKPIPEIAKELGVNYIVEGSGQKYGNSFRLRTQLIMAAKESHLWGESFQQEITEVEDIFRVQSQIAELIAKELKVIISPREKGLIEKIPTSSLAAYDSFLKGKFCAYKTTPEDLAFAMQYFEQAKETDPDFALAYSGIAYVWMFRQQLGITPPEEAGTKIMEAVRKALELDSSLAEVHFMMANMNVLGLWDWEAGEVAYKKAIEINPNHAEAYALYSQLLIILGRQEEAIEHAELALKLDPHNPMVKVWYSADLLLLHRYEDCISLSQEIFEQNPTLFLVMQCPSIALHIKERYDEAFEATKLCFSNIYQEFDHVFDQFEKLGYSDTLNLEGDTLLAQSKSKYIPPADIAYIYILAGNKERALDCLEQAYEMHDPNLIYSGVYPQFTIIHNEPRFQKLLRKMNLPLPYK